MRLPTRGVPVPHTARLSQALRYVIQSFRPRVVVETGTHVGEGSTRAIAQAFGERPPRAFHTIESYRPFFEKAQSNLADVPFVKCVWGLSVDLSTAEEFIKNDPMLRNHWEYDNLYIDNLEDPVSFYLREIRSVLDPENPAACAPDRLLHRFLLLYRTERPLVALDSAGGVGWFEFQETLRLQCDAPFCLFLDDVNHVKHYRSLKHVEADSNFRIVDVDHEDGWLVAFRE